jgi:Ca2+-binding EF-hand superfamily protein
MKQYLRFPKLALFLFFLLSVSCAASHLKTKSQVLSKTEFLSNTFLTESQAGELWKGLFTTDRGSNCKPTTIKKTDILLNTRGKNLPDDSASSAWGSNQVSFSWIKKWGNGPISYFMDFLDPVFSKDFIEESTQIVTEMLKISNKDTDDFKDQFSLSMIPAAKNNPLTKESDYEKLGPKFKKVVYENSCNTNQLNQAIKKWGWYSTEDTPDQAVDLINKYDLNGDGRLSPRELILSTIVHNGNAKGELLCYRCFFMQRKKLDAMFIYLDCTNKGFITAEELWNKLPQLKRSNKSWNIFSSGNSDTIRTNAVNDFILKNSNSVDGGITKDEFTLGILLGFWDRQTDDIHIIKDTSKSMKDYRWSKDGKTDIIANDYLQAKAQAKAEAAKN